MKWGMTLGIVLLVWLLYKYDWPQARAGTSREKAAFGGITAAAVLLSLLLIWLPRMPSALQLIDALFGPLGQVLKQ